MTRVIKPILKIETTETVITKWQPQPHQPTENRVSWKNKCEGTKWTIRRNGEWKTWRKTIAFSVFICQKKGQKTNTSKRPEKQKSQDDAVFDQKCMQTPNTRARLFEHKIRASKIRLNLFLWQWQLRNLIRDARVCLALSTVCRYISK